jgi:hypothetical protein
MTLPYTITNGTKPDADEVMGNFNELIEEVKDSIVKQMMLITPTTTTIKFNSGSSTTKHLYRIYRTMAGANSSDNDDTIYVMTNFNCTCRLAYTSTAEINGFIYLNNFLGEQTCTLSDKTADSKLITETHESIIDATEYTKASVSGLTIKESASDLANISTFGAFGAEFSAGDYTNTQTRDANNRALIGYTVMKIPVQSADTRICITPLLAIASMTGGNNVQSKIEIFGWNYTEGAWVSTGYINLQGSANGSTTGSNCRFLETASYNFILAGSFDARDYVSGGYSYVKLVKTGAGGCSANAITWVEGFPYRR